MSAAVDTVEYGTSLRNGGMNYRYFARPQTLTLLGNLGILYPFQPQVVSPGRETLEVQQNVGNSP
jgi:hypothetical protein